LPWHRKVKAGTEGNWEGGKVVGRNHERKAWYCSSNKNVFRSNVKKKKRRRLQRESRGRKTSLTTSKKQMGVDDRIKENWPPWTIRD